jgi:hypothetical protein
VRNKPRIIVDYVVGRSVVGRSVVDGWECVGIYGGVRDVTR